MLRTTLRTALSRLVIFTAVVTALNFCSPNLDATPSKPPGKPGGTKTWPTPPPTTRTPPPKTHITPPKTHITPPRTHTYPTPPIHINVVPPRPTYTQPPPTYIAPPPTYIVPNQPQVIAPPPTAVVRPNALPPATQMTMKPNLLPDRSVAQALKPNYELLARAISYEELAAAFAAVQAEQQQKLDEIIDGLGPDMLADPDVAAALDNLQDKIDNGEEITDADLAAVNDAVINALNNGVPITGGATEASVNQALGSLQTLSQIQQILSFWPPGGIDIPFPGGITGVIFDPFLPADAVYVLPGGAILDGTGGVGGFEIGQGTLAEAAGLPPGVGEAVPPSADPGNCLTSGLIIMNPAVNAVGMEYVVNNQNYSTPAGYNQTFSGTGSWLTQFNRGPGFGDGRYSLNEGTYYFTSTDKGWELYVRSFTVVIDNAENPKSFEYVVGNTNSSVAGGQSQTHTSKYPICIKFDRGGGNQPAQKLIGDPTVGKTQLRVAINTDDNLWDLYPAKNFAAATTPTAAPGATPGAPPTVPTLKFAPPPASKATPGKLSFPPAAALKSKKSPSWPVPTKKPGKLPAAPVPEPPADKP